MNINEFISAPKDEKPLDRICDDGGFTSIFRTIACVGDSLSSGELEAHDHGANTTYHDIFDISWGQYIARFTGSKVYNFSRGGMTASEYNDTYADAMGWWDKSLAAQAYIVALGCNDILNCRQPVGQMSDIHDDWHTNEYTYTGNMGKLIQRLKEIQPDAKFFLLTMPIFACHIGNKEIEELYNSQAEVVYNLAEKFSNTYVVDLKKYGPVYDDDFQNKFFVGGHMNTQGYYLTGKMVASYIDYIIRHNFDDFKKACFIGTPWGYVE